MYKVKLSPEEALETIKLRMNYDSSKTLNENVSVLKEQDMAADVDMIKRQFDAGNTDEQAIVDILKKYDTPEKFREMLNKYKTDTSKELGPELQRAFNTFNDKTEIKDLGDFLAKIGYSLEIWGNSVINIVPNAPIASGFESLKRQKNINAIFCSVKGDVINLEGYYKGKLWSNYVYGHKITAEEIEKAKKSCGKSGAENSGGNSGGGSSKSSIPAELKDVKAFQDWLDKNHPGWHDKYNTLGKDVAKGYGKFGPRTTKAWATYKDEYLKGTNTPTVTPTPTGNPDLEVDDKDAGFDQPF